MTKERRSYFIEWKNNICDLMITVCDGALMACIVAFTILIILFIVGVRI